MSDEEDPFEHLDESVDDRTGDPFEHLDEPPAEDAVDEPPVEDAVSEQPAEGATSAGPEESPADQPASEPEPGYDAHDVTPAGHREELQDRGETADTAGAGPTSADADGPTVKTDHGAAVDPEDPFADVGTREGDPFDDDVFEEMDTGGVDPDDVWDSLADAENRGSVSDIEDRIYAEVSKHRYCEQCEFFSDPPDVRCSHDETEILEFVDNETVRVVDCPVVAERKELEKHD